MFGMHPMMQMYMMQMNNMSNWNTYDNWQRGSMRPVFNLEPATEQEVEAFFEEYPGLDEKSRERLKRLHPKLQKLVIGKGSMADATDVSKVLMQRCKFADTMSPEDW